MHASYWLLVNVYQRPKPVQLLLDFPDPTDEFYGYTNRTIQLLNGQEFLHPQPGAHNRLAATALLALQAGEYAGGNAIAPALPLAYRRPMGLAAGRD